MLRCEQPVQLINFRILMKQLNEQKMAVMRRKKYLLLLIWLRNIFSDVRADDE
jgi:hypothetical protein